MYVCMYVCMYEILSLCAYLFVFCHLYASFFEFILLDFTMYIFIVKTYIHKNPKLLHLRFLSKSLKLKCSIFVLNLLIAGQNTDSR